MTTSLDELWTLCGPFVLPSIRILAFVSTCPVLSHRAFPKKIKLLSGIALAIVITPLLPQTVNIFSLRHALVLCYIFHEIIVGWALGFILQILFAAFVVAGEVINLQTGLGFAMSFGHFSIEPSPIFAELYLLFAMFIFVTSDGLSHVIVALYHSFFILPATQAHFMRVTGHVLSWSSCIFSIGLQIALPIMISLLITNLGLGILSRSVPQLNIFTLGFQVTCIVGLVTLWLLFGDNLRFMATIFDKIPHFLELGGNPSL